MIVIGTRGSNLALAQANEVLNSLSKVLPNLTFKIKVIKSKGDKLLNSPLSKIGGKGLFTKELEDALLGKDIDIAVHSLKDLPTEMPKDLEIGAILKREDARDILIKNPKSQNPNPKRIGTSSPRRKAQLLAKNPDLEIVDLRGNLETRIRKMEEQNMDAIVLAFAGIKRLKTKLNYEILPLDQMLPAPGQGAIAIQIRRKDKNIENIVKTINHEPTQIETAAERSFLTALGGGCQVPVGAYAKVRGAKIYLKGCVVSVDGMTVLKDKVSGAKIRANKIGIILANKLIKKGAAKLL